MHVRTALSHPGVQTETGSEIRPSEKKLDPDPQQGEHTLVIYCPAADNEEMTVITQCYLGKPQKVIF